MKRQRWDEGFITEAKEGRRIRKCTDINRFLGEERAGRGGV